MTVPTVEQHTSSGVTWGATTQTITFGATPTNGDVIVLAYVFTTDPSAAPRTWPGGFSEFASGNAGTAVNIALAKKVASGESSGQYVLNLGNTNDGNQVLLGFTMRGASNTLDVQGSIEADYGDPVTVSAVTTVDSDVKVVIYTGTSDANTAGTRAATGWTSDYTAAGDPRVGIISKTFASPGSTGSVSMSGCTTIADNTWIALGFKTNAVSTSITAVTAEASAAAPSPTFAARQIARPISDISNTGWTASTGSDLYAMVDEATKPDDTDYIYSSTAPAGDVCELKVGSLSSPTNDTVVVIRHKHD